MHLHLENHMLHQCGTTAVYIMIREYSNLEKNGLEVRTGLSILPDKLPARRARRIEIIGSDDLKILCT